MWLPIATYVDTFYQVPLVCEKDIYLKKLIEIIDKEKISYIIPLIDTEVDFLSENRDIIESHNVIICIPNDKTIKICRNKLTFYEFFKNDKKIKLIPTFEPLKFPLKYYNLPIIAKPQIGRSSEGCFIINTIDEFTMMKKAFKGYVFQPFFKGDIYTVDLVRDNKHDKSFAISRKELIRTKNGAGTTIELSLNKYLNELTEYIGKKLQINGCVNMEYIQKDNDFYLMDINPRFSAGISFSILAGYDMVMNHIHCFTGKGIQEPITYKTMIMVKKLTDEIIYIEQ